MLLTTWRQSFTSRLLLSGATAWVTLYILVVLRTHTWAIPNYSTSLSDYESIQSSKTFHITPIRTSIPRKLWYKLGPKGLSKDSAEWTNSCITKNPSYRVEFLTDFSGDTYVKEHYSHRPDIVELYLSLPIPILKADLLRYLILYAEGGIWNDLDATCSDIQISDWLTPEIEEAASIIVGLEFDMPWEDDNFLHSQFASWTIMAKPGAKHMLTVIDDVLDRIYQVAEQHNVTVSELTYDQIGLVVDLTGPKGMTRSLVKSLEASLGTTIDDRNVSGLLVPKLIDDVAILPGNQFAAAQSGYPENQGPVLVTHQYAGTWKNDHGGEDP